MLCLSAISHKPQKASTESGIFQSLGIGCFFLLKVKVKRGWGAWHNVPLNMLLEHTHTHTEKKTTIKLKTAKSITNSTLPCYDAMVGKHECVAFRGYRNPSRDSAYKTGCTRINEQMIKTEKPFIKIEKIKKSIKSEKPLMFS